MEKTAMEDPSPEPEPAKLLSIDIMKGPMGFGFRIAGSAYGQIVTQIQDRAQCKMLREGDILIEINHIKLNNKTHADVVGVMKSCPCDVPVKVLVKRGSVSRSGHFN